MSRLFPGGRYMSIRSGGFKVSSSSSSDLNSITICGFCAGGSQQQRGTFRHRYMQTTIQHLTSFHRRLAALIFVWNDKVRVGASMGHTYDDVDVGCIVYLDFSHDSVRKARYFAGATTLRL